MMNYYKILEVDKNASAEVIEKAYKALVKKNHPDLKEGEEKVKAEEEIKKINEAYEVLSDPEKKRQYDIKLAETEISTEQYEELKREKEILKRQVNNMQNRGKEETTINQPRNNVDYDPLKNPVKYYSKRIQQYNKAMQDEEYMNQLENQRRQAEYNNYINNLKRRGYKIRYKKTFKDYLKAAGIIVIMIIVAIILYHIPFINKFLKNIYENNAVIKAIVDLISNIGKSFINTLTNPSLL